MVDTKKAAPSSESVKSAKTAQSTKNPRTLKAQQPIKGQKLYIIHGWTNTTAPWTQTIAE